jgi:hypothetical protein
MQLMSCLEEKNLRLQMSLLTHCYDIIPTTNHLLIKEKKKISIQAKTDCFRDLQMLICIEGFMPHQLDVQSTVVLIRIYGNRLHSADNDQLVSLRAAIFECTGGRMKRPI